MMGVKAGKKSIASDPQKRPLKSSKPEAEARERLSSPVCYANSAEIRPEFKDTANIIESASSQSSVPDTKKS